MSQGDVAVWQDLNGGLSSIDLQREFERAGLASDIVGRLVTGDVRSVEFRHNFQRCAFRSANLSDCPWSNVDFKDCVFTASVFTDCELGEGSTVSCTFSGCAFIRTSFNDAAFHECIYIDCEFVDCDFSGSMIRNSQLYSSSYKCCRTTNKLFDGCIILDSDFQNTWLDFRAIIDNFGLDHRQICHELVRPDRSHPGTTPVDFESILDEITCPDGRNSFELLRLSYYLSSDGLTDNAFVDEVFEPSAWTALVRAPVNFNRLLQDFADFIFYLYDHDRIPIHFVVKLSALSDGIWNSFNSAPGAAHLGQTAAGVHLQCLQRLESLEFARQALSGSSGGRKLVYQSFDYATDEDISALAEALLRHLNGASVEIRPRNSPVDLVFSLPSWATLLIGIYIFLSTKTRLQLSHAPKRKQADAHDEPILNLEVGGGQDKELQSIISFGGRMPGVVAFRFEINVSTALLMKVRNVVQDVRIEK